MKEFTVDQLYHNHNIYIYIYIYVWVNYNDLTGIMVNKGQMALIQVSEILSFTQICIYDYVYIYTVYYIPFIHTCLCVCHP
jgi:hypothetical protein